ncbi:probable receptor-like protein kinase At2g39360 [Rutidosis leptorrhynchoides]|uniref:probable receptor-like protein kinase At2g39360 n=1 Tax=Rutidosis leptorrhynchoides TaxID=125765 RepID=UPI003A98D61D
MSGEDVESSLSLESLHPCRQFTIAEIQLVTDNFDESLVIGRGGFGKVYRGTITNGVTRLDVAVKRLDTTSNQGALEFWTEVKMLSQLRHCHLVSLIGYCNDMQEMALVYEFMPRGTLEDHLHKLRAPLTWIRRLKICIGAARGLDYLHTGTGIKHGVIHRDVKSSNILLDDTWAAKISDFGLSKIGPINQSDSGVNTLVKGTFGYLDPDYYQTGRLTRKSDVYAFGVVLFEVLCEKRAVDRSLDEDQWGLACWLAVGCLHSHPKQRPTMSQVVVALERILALQVKEDDKIQAQGMTTFGKRMSTFVFPSNRKNSVGVESLKPLELYLSTVQDENQLLRRFHFEAIEVATEKFSESNKICDEGYGCLYKGRLQNGHDVTVLSPYWDFMKDKELVINQVSVLVKLKHKNLIELIGYCIEKEKRVYLVYNCAPQATLDCIMGDPRCTLLNWNKRYKILLGIARELVYLHKQAPDPIIHGDVKPENIVLDERFYPNLSNFGLASQIEETDRTRVDRVCGNRGNIAPELVLRSCLSAKADVYSFGITVLETITGRKVSEMYQFVE